MSLVGKVKIEFFWGPHNVVPSAHEYVDQDEVSDSFNQLDCRYPYSIYLRDNDEREIDFGYTDTFSGRDVPGKIREYEGDLSEVVVRQMVEKVF